MLNIENMKKIWIIALATLLFGNIHSVATAQPDETPEMEMEAIHIIVRGNRAHITNADGKTLEIYNLTGVRVAFIPIDGNDKQLPLNLTRGCYIMKVGKVVRKITIL